MDLAPLATVVGTVLLCRHSPSPSILIPVLSTSKCHPVVVGCPPIVTERTFWRRLTVLKSGTCRSRPASLSKLCAMPTAWRKGRIESPLRCTSGCGPACRLHGRASGGPCPARPAASHAPSTLRCIVSSWSSGTSVLLGTHAAGLPAPQLGGCRAGCMQQSREDYVMTCCSIARQRAVKSAGLTKCATKPCANDFLRSLS